MTTDGKDILRVLSREQVARLQSLGATVTAVHVTATEEQLWHGGIIGGLRSKLLRGNQLTIGGGGGGSYHAKAIQFGADSYLRCQPASFVNSSSITHSMWILLSPSAMSNFPFLCSVGSFGNMSGNWSPEIGYFHSTDFGDVIWNNSSQSKSLTIDTPDGTYPSDSAWHHIFISYDTNFSAGQKKGNIYLDGVSVLNHAATVDNDTAFTIEWSEVFGGTDPGWSFMDLSTHFPILAADVWIATGQYLDPVTNISKFRNPSTGKPVDLGPTGLLPTGVAPSIFLTGDATSFQTNKGTAGQPVLTGTIANASSSPSD